MALEADKHRPKRDRRTAHQLFEAIKQDRFTGSYSRVTAFIRQWQNHSSASNTKTAFVFLKFALGEAFQFDWSEESLMIGGTDHADKTIADMLMQERTYLMPMPTPFDGYIEVLAQVSSIKCMRLSSRFIANCLVLTLASPRRMNS